MTSGGYKATSERLIYFTACVVIIYYPKSNEQKHYTEHEVKSVQNLTK